MTKRKVKKPFRKLKVFGKPILLSKLRVAITIVLIALVLFISGSFFISSVLNDNLLTQEKEKVISAREAAEPNYDTERLAKIATLHDLNIIASMQPSYSSKIDACYVTHSDQGWIAANWYQDCYIRYVDLFLTSMQRAEILTKLDTVASTPRQFGKPETFNPKICDTLYEDKYKPTLIYYDPSQDVSNRSRKCKIPKSTQDTFTVKGPIVLDRELATNYKKTFKIEDVDNSSKYIIMQSDNYYYHESLGCGLGMWCPSPRENPVTGF